ncbi:MAG: hypothetical protein ACOC46_04455, partial [Pirellulales bacterium]
RQREVREHNGEGARKRNGWSPEGFRAIYLRSGRPAAGGAPGVDGADPADANRMVYRHLRFAEGVNEREAEAALRAFAIPGSVDDTAELAGRQRK